MACCGPPAHAVARLLPARNMLPQFFTLSLLPLFPAPMQFVCNGLLWPDRSLHPAALEVKQLQAPLGISLAGTAESTVAGAAGAAVGSAVAMGAQQQQQQQQPEDEVRLLLRNKQYFSSTTSLALRWRLLADGLPAPATTAGGKPSAAGRADAEGCQALQLPQPLGPQQEAAVGLGVTWADLAQRAQHAAEGCLEVQAQVGRPAACASLFGSELVLLSDTLWRQRWSNWVGLAGARAPCHAMSAHSPCLLSTRPLSLPPLPACPAVGSRPAVGPRWARGADRAAAFGQPPAVAAAAAASAAAAAAGRAATYCGG